MLDLMEKRCKIKHNKRVAKFAELIKRGFKELDGLRPKHIFYIHRKIK